MADIPRTDGTIFAHRGPKWQLQRLQEGRWVADERPIWSIYEVDSRPYERSTGPRARLVNLHTGTVLWDTSLLDQD